MFRSAGKDYYSSCYNMLLLYVRENRCENTNLSHFSKPRKPVCQLLPK